MPSYSINKYIAAGVDDGFSKAGTYNFTANYTAMGFSYATGMRWTNVTIPQGSTIDSATITFKCSTAYSTAVTTTIYGIDEDNFNGFTDSAGDRPHDYAGLTSASVSWVPAAWVINLSYNTDSIKTIIQEIVDRASWASGNALGVVIRSSSSASREAKTYESAPTNSPRLNINYTDVSGFKAKITIIN